MPSLQTPTIQIVAIPDGASGSSHQLYVDVTDGRYEELDFAWSVSEGSLDDATLPSGVQAYIPPFTVSVSGSEANNLVTLTVTIGGYGCEPFKWKIVNSSGITIASGTRTAPGSFTFTQPLAGTSNYTRTWTGSVTVTDSRSVAVTKEYSVPVTYVVPAPTTPPDGGGKTGGGKTGTGGNK